MKTKTKLTPFPIALRKAIDAIRDEQRAGYIQSTSSRYRLTPDNRHPRGYTIQLSVRYDDEWQPWFEVEHFGIDDILCDKWSFV